MNVTISIVSHSQSVLVIKLLKSFDDYLFCQDHKVRIIITENTHDIGEYTSKFQLMLYRNSTKQGFGLNHNTAFKNSNADIFLIVNPDIILIELFNLDFLIYEMLNKNISLTSPIIVNNKNIIEDYKRSDITISNIIQRQFFRNMHEKHDWYAGMFIIVTAECFQKTGGFDTRFYMYVEDCDLCMRAQALGYKLADVIPVRVLHDARRASKNSWRHMYWHITSLIKYYLKKKL